MGDRLHSAIEKARPFVKQRANPLTTPRNDPVALTPDSEQTRADKLAARQAAEQEVLMREVDEAVRKEQLGGAVQRYGWAIAGTLVLALAAFGGWLWWQSRQEGEMEERSEKLITAYDQLEGERIAEAEVALTELAGSGSSAQAVSAKLARAGIALNQNRRADAVTLYESIAGDADAPQPYRDLASIRLMAVQFEEVEPQVVIDRLKPLATPGNPWFGSAGELVGMAYLKQGKENLAGPLFAEIAKNEDVPQTLRSRTRQLAGLLGYDAVVDVDQALADLRQETGAAPEPVAAPPPAPEPAQ